MHNSKTLWLSVISVALLSIFLCSPAFAGKVTVWKGQSAISMPQNVGPFQRGVHGSGNVSMLFSRWLETETKGQLKLDVALPGAIVPVKEMFRAVSKGIIDFAGGYYGGFHSGVMPETDIEIGLPFAWERPEEAWDALYNRGLLKELRKIYAEHNIYWTPFIANTGYGFGTTFHCTGLDSIKGKKIRALGIYGDFVKALGGSPVVMPGSELYMALKLGTIDGTIFGLENLENDKLKEVWKEYVIEPNFNTIVVGMLINMDSFKKLPAETQRLIDDNAKYVFLDTTMTNYAWDRYWAAKASREYPFKLTHWPEKDIAKARKIAVGLWDQVAKKSPRCAKLVEIVKQQMRDLGKIE